MEHHIKNGDQIMFNTNNAHKAIICPKNFLIVLTALVCFLSSTVVSAQMQSNFPGLIPGNSCIARVTAPDTTGSNCEQVDPTNLDTNTGNISGDYDETASANGIGIIDWVVVELYVFPEGHAFTLDASNRVILSAGQIAVHRQAALLRSDGTIINANAQDLTDKGEVLTLDYEGFDDSTQDAYIVINHRFHLSIMSANPVIPDVEYNFTETGKIRGTEGFNFKRTTPERKPGNPNVLVATGGDLDVDGIIRFASDGPILTNNPGPSLGYYVLGDINLDSATTAAVDLPYLLRALDNQRAYVN